MKRKTLLCVAVAGLAAVIVAIAPLTGRTEEVASAQPAPESAAPAAPEAKVTPLLSKDLKDLSGKEGLMITVVYPPGASDPIHRHNAYAFLYVLEGSVVMQLKGGKEITLAPGQTFL